MLGRTANDLYWLSRYVERAENMARLVEVGYRIALLPRESADDQQEWRSTLTTADCADGYFAKYKTPSTRDAVHYLLFDADNPSSVRSCLAAARHNGRAHRIVLTAEMWESLNQTWLDFSQIRPADVGSNELPGLLSWVKQRSALFRGTLLGTILHNDTFFFSQLGAFIERTDNTARILDVKYYVLLPQNEIVGGGVDSLQWSAILRSVSAHRSFRWVYKESYTPWRIAEYLILNPQMPRSLIYCYRELATALNELERAYGTRHLCHDLVAEGVALLQGTSMQEIFQSGLHEFLTGFIGRNNHLGAEISQAYHFLG